MKHPKALQARKRHRARAQHFKESIKLIKIWCHDNNINFIVQGRVHAQYIFEREPLEVTFNVFSGVYKAFNNEQKVLTTRAKLYEVPQLLQELKETFGSLT